MYEFEKTGDYLLFSHRNYMCTIIYRLAHLCELKQNAILKEFGVTHQQIQYIAFLYARNNQEVFQRDIEKEFCLKSSTVTQIMNTLEKSGFIERIPSMTDRRTKRLRITDKAKTLHQKFLDSVLQVDELLQKDLTNEEKGEIHKSLLKIYQNIRDDY